MKKNKTSKQPQDTRYGPGETNVKEIEEQVDQQLKGTPRTLREGEMAFFMINEFKIPCIVGRVKIMGGSFFYDLFIPIKATSVEERSGYMETNDVPGRFVIPQI